MQRLKMGMIHNLGMGCCHVFLATNLLSFCIDCELNSNCFLNGVAKFSMFFVHFLQRCSIIMKGIRIYAQKNMLFLEHMSILSRERMAK